jgi:acetyl esterase/lipase
MQLLTRTFWLASAVGILVALKPTMHAAQTPWPPSTMQYPLESRFSVPPPRGSVTPNSSCEIAEEYVRQINAKRPATHVADLFAEDAVVLQGRGKVLRGRQEIHGFYDFADNGRGVIPLSFLDTGAECVMEIAIQRYGPDETWRLAGARHFTIGPDRLITKLVFFDYQSGTDGPGAPSVTTDVVYGHKAGLTLTFDVYRPAVSNGAGVISVLSGGWRSGWDMLQEFKQAPNGSFQLLTDEEINAKGGILPSHNYRPLLDKGFTVFAVRHGSSPMFAMPGIVADLRRAVRFIRAHARDYGVDPDRIGIWGGSAGGHLALLLGTTAEISNADAADEFERGPCKLAAVVAYAPPTDLARIAAYWRQSQQAFPAVLDLSPDAMNAYSPLRHVSSDDAPALIVHGDKDTTVPTEQGKLMADALTNAGVDARFVLIEGAAHGFLGDNAARANREMVAWFERYLLKR